MHRLISLFALGLTLSVATSDLYASCNGGILRAVFGSQPNHCEPRCTPSNSSCMSVCPSVSACVETYARSCCQALESTPVHVPNVSTLSDCVSSFPQPFVQPSAACVPAHVVPSMSCEVIASLDSASSVVVPSTSCCGSCENVVSQVGSVEVAPVQSEVESQSEVDRQAPTSDPSPSDELQKRTPEASKSTPTPDPATSTSASPSTSTAVPTSQTAVAPSEPAKTDLDRQTEKTAQPENSVQPAKEDLDAAKLAAEAVAKKQEAERHAAEKLAAEKLAAEAKAQELEKQQLEKTALEKTALEKAALEKAELEKAALEKAELEKAALEKERIEKERVEKERLAKEQQLEQERLAQEQAQREQAEKDRLEKQRIEAERLEAERLAKEKASQPSQPKAAAADASVPATNPPAVNTTSVNSAAETPAKPQVPVGSDLMLSVKSIQITDKKPDGEQWDNGSDADVRLVVTAAGVTIRPPDGKDKNAIELDRGVARVKVGYIIQIDASDVDLMFNDPIGTTKHTITADDFAEKSIELSFGSVKSLVLELSQ